MSFWFGKKLVKHRNDRRQRASEKRDAQLLVGVGGVPGKRKSWGSVAGEHSV